MFHPISDVVRNLKTSPTQQFRCDQVNGTEIDHRRQPWRRMLWLAALIAYFIGLSG